MKLSFAHLEIWRSRRAALTAAAFASALGLSAPAAAACGAAAGAGRIAEVTDRLELRLEDGRLVRLAGLDLPDRQRGDPETAAGALALLRGRFVGQEVGLVSFAARSDRWGRFLADLSLAGASGEGESVA